MRKLIAAAAILAVVFVIGCQDTKKVTELQGTVDKLTQQVNDANAAVAKLTTERDSLNKVVAELMAKLPQPKGGKTTTKPTGGSTVKPPTKK